MKNWLKVQNEEAFEICKSPVLSVDALCDGVVHGIRNGMRPVQFFGRPDGDVVRLAVCLAGDDHSLYVAEAQVTQGQWYSAITQEVEAMHLFERELYEQTGVIPQGHPWLKPVRFENGADVHSYPFLEAESEEMHVVAVGPVHAGIIEPGHFRFLCHGEDVLHLEIQLGYQHRGVERLFCGKKPLSKATLAESIAGDTVIGHAWAYAAAVEAIGQTVVSERAQAIRAIGLELERIAVHLAGLGGISSDIGFLQGDAVYGRLRTAVINTSLQICGSRFGRGLIRPGGVLFDIDDDFQNKICQILLQVEQDTEKINRLLFETPSVMSRLEHTGTIDQKVAERIGLTGLMAKMTGRAIDSRYSHPLGHYAKEKDFQPVTANTGDVYARTMVRVLEIGQSIRLVRKWIHLGIPSAPAMTTPNPLHPGMACVVLVEGWRGEISHMVFTDSASDIAFYKIVDPSFHNWFGLALAVRGNGISDFPICNKSFDLSYCGHDL